MVTLLNTIVLKHGIPVMARPDWDSYFIEIAHIVAKRSTCNRLQVGCVLTFENKILATGYGGAMRGAPHCTEAGCLMVNGGCTRTVHAEQNAICQAAYHGVSPRGCIAYITDSPCRTCAMMLVNAGVSAILYARLYRINDHLNEVRALGLLVEHISNISKEVSHG